MSDPLNYRNRKNKYSGERCENCISSDITAFQPLTTKEIFCNKYLTYVGVNMVCDDYINWLDGKVNHD